ncbi:TPA: hypothetical protein N0F65_007689, partial [Lagenidium giganteum]
LVYDDIRARVGHFRKTYPNHTVDLTFLEEREDSVACRGGLSYLSRTSTDISTIIRARRCAAPANFWRTTAMRQPSCFCFVSSDKRMAISASSCLLRSSCAGSRSLPFIDTHQAPCGVATVCPRSQPSSGLRQCPSVLCYALAHYIDVWSSTTRLWRQTNGVPGIPEYTIASVACATVLSQLRANSWRDTRVESIDLLSVHNSIATSITPFTSSGSVGYRLLEGVIIDVKYLTCEVVVVVVVLRSRRAPARRRHELLSIEPLQDAVVGRTPVPHTVKSLWPATTMRILRRGPVFRKFGFQHDPSGPHHSTRLTTITKRSTHSTVRVVLAQLGASMHWPIGGTSEKTLRFLQLQFESVASRRDDMNAIVAFINLGNMIDPWVWFRLRVGSPQSLAYYVCPRRPEVVLLLRQDLMRQGLVSHELQLPNASDLHSDLIWLDLLQQMIKVQQQERHQTNEQPIMSMCICIVLPITKA